MIRHHDHTQPGEERIYFSLQLPDHTEVLTESGQELRQDRNLDAGAEAEAVEEGCLSVYTLGLFRLLSYSHDQQPMMDCVQ